MMINGLGLHEKIQARLNGLQEMQCKAASESCESTQEEVPSHQPVQGEQPSALRSIQPTL